jgi:hypothetical protein
VREKGIARLQICEERHKWVRCGVAANDDAVTLKNAIGFRGGEQETITAGVLLDSGSQGELVETPVGNFIRPHKLSKTEESIKAREELSKEE